MPYKVDSLMACGALIFTRAMWSVEAISRVIRGRSREVDETGLASLNRVGKYKLPRLTPTSLTLSEVDFIELLVISCRSKWDR